MKSIRYCLLSLALVLCSGAAQADKPSDAAALQGVTHGKVVFDINAADARRLDLYLAVIRETHDDLKRQGVRPDIILAFRGLAVSLVSTDRERFELTEFEHLDHIAERIAALRELGVRMEGCSIATRLFKVDNATLLEGITPVGNTFVSLTGYQAQGYAIIPIY